jgi:hypothetical protein
MSSGAIGSERLHVVGLGDVVVTAEQEDASGEAGGMS